MNGCEVGTSAGAIQNSPRDREMIEIKDDVRDDAMGFQPFLPKGPNFVVKRPKATS